METTIIILSIAVALIGLSFFALSKYRNYVFKKKSYSELITILRESRKTYNRLTYYGQIECTYGRILLSSINAIEKRIAELNNA